MTKSASSDLGGPATEPDDAVDRAAIVRLFDQLDADDQRKVMDYLIELARKPRS